MRKLEALGFTGTLGRWLGNFLSNRLQAVRVGAEASSWAPVVSGIPQGSVLGPLFFLVFIADLGVDLAPGSTSKVLKYVDDTKVIWWVKSPRDVEALQEDLNLLYSWQARNNMEWNAGKFLGLRMGAIPSIWEDTLLFTPNFSEPIPSTEEAKDLGIIMDDKANFGPQRAKASAKAKAKASWVLWTFMSRGLAPMRTLW